MSDSDVPKVSLAYAVGVHGRPFDKVSAHPAVKRGGAALTSIAEDHFLRTFSPTNGSRFTADDRARLERSVKELISRARIRLIVVNLRVWRRWHKDARRLFMQLIRSVCPKAELMYISKKGELEAGI